MSSAALFSGVLVANITPFDEKGKLSLSGLESHLRFLIERGVHGLVPCGTTGEGAMLTAGERRQVLECALRLARPKGLKVIAGCGSSDTANTLEMILEAKALGCDAALVVSPYYVKPGPAGLLAHYLHLADHGDFPIVLYNVPSRTAINMPVDVMVKLLEHPRIVGIKEASGQHSQWLRLARSMDLKQRALLAGDDDAFATLLAMGGSGTISASANVLPEVFVALYDHARKAQWEQAFALQKRLQPLLQALFMETNPAPAKMALELLGRGKFSLRLPLVPVAEPTEEALRTTLREWEGKTK